MGWRVVHEPKSYDETYRDLAASLGEHLVDQTDDADANFFREIRRDAALEMLTAASDAYERRALNHAWYFLVRAAEAIGYLVASQVAVYPREDDADLRSSLRKSGSKGGTTKGQNAKKREDEIAEKLRAAKPSGNGWDKSALRKEYNRVTDGLENYKDPDRKWRALLKRADIQDLLSKGQL